MTMAASTRTVSRIAASRRSAAWACTDLVTEAVTFLMTCSAMSSVVCMERSRSALSTSTLAGSDMIAIRLTICCCSVLASGDPAPSTSLMPNSVDGSVPGQGDHRGPQLRLGQVGAAGDQDFLHRHLPAGADRPAQALRLGADLLVVDAHRCVDDVFGGQQDRRVEGHPLPQTEAVVGHLVHQHLTAVEQGVHARSDIVGDVGVAPACPAVRTCVPRSSSWRPRRHVRRSRPAARHPKPTCTS